MKKKKSDSPVTRSEFLKEINKLSTKDDLNKLDDKVNKLDDKFDKAVNRLAAEIVKTQSDLREVKDHIETKLATKDDISRVLNAIDAFTVKAKNYDDKALFHGYRIEGLDENVKDHEVRITQLEKRVSQS